MAPAAGLTTALALSLELACWPLMMGRAVPSMYSLRSPRQPAVARHSGREEKRRAAASAQRRRTVAAVRAALPHAALHFSKPPLPPCPHNRLGLPASTEASPLPFLKGNKR